MTIDWRRHVDQEIAETRAKGVDWTPWRLILSEDERKVGQRTGATREEQSQPSRCGTKDCHEIAAYVSYSTFTKARTMRCAGCHAKAVRKHGPQ